MFEAKNFHGINCTRKHIQNWIDSKFLINRKADYEFLSNFYLFSVYLLFFRFITELYEMNNDHLASEQKSKKHAWKKIKKFNQVIVNPLSSTNLEISHR